MKEIKKSIKRRKINFKKICIIIEFFFSRKSELWEKGNKKKKNYSFKKKFYIHLNIFLSEKNQKCKKKNKNYKKTDYFFI